MPKLHFNMGGVNCHNLYFENLAPYQNGGGVIPNQQSPFMIAIDKDFGSLQNFMKLFTERTTSIMGSGWGWLGIDP